MCIGLPCQIVSIDPQTPHTATASVGGVHREVDITLISSTNEATSELIGKWVLVHVGFAMSLIDEQEAQATLEALSLMGELEPDVNTFLYGNQRQGIK